jgi:hypothetical protein
MSNHANQVNEAIRHPLIIHLEDQPYRGGWSIGVS